MREIIEITDAERLLMLVIDENPAVFADGFVDWSHVRDYAILACVNHNIAQGKRKAAVQQACTANNVNRTYYYNNDLVKKRFI